MTYNFVIIIVLQIVSESPYLTMDMLERCFPYALLRDAYSSVYRHSHIVSELVIVHYLKGSKQY